MGRVIDTHAQDWSPVRTGLTEGVTGKLLLDGAVKVVLTRVASGGVFRPHQDEYAHLFHILAGSGVVQLGTEEFSVAAGMTVQVDAGELHGYRNPGRQDLLLLSMNLAGA